MDVKEIVKAWLKENGYTALMDMEYGECGCGGDDIMCCGENAESCVAAYDSTCVCGNTGWSVIKDYHAKECTCEDPNPSYEKPEGEHGEA